MNAPFRFGPHVMEARASHQPIVALETVVVAFGLPRPANLQVALEMEEAVRAEGAVPATIGLLDGQVVIGLTPDELERFAEDAQVVKVSRRDLPIVLARRGIGATTVAATVWAAARAGIPVVATGGIGGVHRGAPYDVSNDLPTLAAEPVLVVCSGAKAILDLRATREWLETHGIPILGWGVETLPAFYSASSGLPVDARVDSAEEAAAIARTHWALGGKGILVAVPPPASLALPMEPLEEILQEALREAEERRVQGWEVTPFLLARMAERTAGESVQVNRALLLENARIAARIARALAE
ncbi:pseudouridine-5'-phosphate glycosidase [Thermoflexus sp.]|uniref:pseudouridine-5'-phosphate glycosidase n=1 Tax=Thermoflexus sp. TaxID=1969742 RepID=UPI0025FD721A|nr:pseudouridine-5'-phosphate glycosidase [Thermoflexus sp.]MDW8064511.1 pseudouridine-5'-phosphate glycosidase [Anaerolineae bacterium]MCS6964861.1 pseudouridine-5'-phosphate glycosidase [Thermoflexus sp.]MCS7350918.1 pseudouridine-5'-phosphate glycosidase [Thermoflexus sp.]MCX7690063.1 pseudouridine-5'-phosphate glycosidase [Thermoflexus sp.]MDW8180369.1 pseudouridine-5'-phosphate glycosidase [Anaerolineae bacterium]